MPRKITAKGGPLHGKKFTVPENMTSFEPPVGYVAGKYRVTEKQAVWEPERSRQSAEPADKVD
ncbi:hypothetical protein [Agrococcus casei]|uniref:Uncharacterized protein n=1 Tax=Agrococcus casei LMG 22410 TaxID=1255656 RepID=A0A1R4FGM1_9MICO|nr:hypothetical protein [Agrococcus casei]SJM55007.1 hypothetical protein CZ674_04425 [Agrococcus casei LMG 22410]